MYLRILEKEISSSPFRLGEREREGESRVEMP